MKPRRSQKRTVAVSCCAAEAEVAVGPRQHLVDDRLGDEPREHVAHPLPLDGRDEIVAPERPSGSERERHQRVDDRNDPAVLERELGGEAEETSGRDGRRDGIQRAQLGG